MLCELCGKEKAEYLAEVEGVTLALCNKCKSFGENVRVVKEEKIKEKIKKKKKSEEKAEEEEIIVDNFAELIRKKREAINLTQEDLAKKINERVSLIKKIESNQIKPSLQLAKKLEKFLGIKLIEKIYYLPLKTKKQETTLTLGDIIKIKRKSA